MNTKNQRFTVLFGVLILAAAGLFSCKKDEVKPDPVVDINSYLRFNHEVDGAAVEYDTIRYINDFGNDYSIETVRYFLSNMEFVDQNGHAVTIANAIYIDAKDEDYKPKKFTTAIPNGTYTEMRFTFGLDSAMNKTGAFPNFPEAAMEWPMMMGGGYHYMKLEGKYLHADSYNHFNFHTGPLNNNQNYFQVVLPMILQVTDGSFDVTLVMEIQNWFRNPNTFDLSTISGGMMGDQSKQELVRNNGYDVFHID